MDDNNKNLILATVLSIFVLIGWFYFFPPPEPVVSEDPNAVAATETAPTAAPVAAETGTSNASTAAVTEATENADAPRLQIDTARLKGSISLQGGRIDDLSLKNYRETLDADSDIVHLFNPTGSVGRYYALYGWAPGAGLSLDQVPGANTIWSAPSGGTLTETNPVMLTWDNGSGLVFTREISVDENYMFSIKQNVLNKGAGTVSLAPYGILARHGEPQDTKNFFILHEGMIVMSDGELTEASYGDVADYDFNASEGAKAEVAQVSESGWIGFTDHYWMATLIPNQTSPFKSVAKYDERRDIYQTEAVLPTQSLANGQSATVETQLFAGAKEWAAIREYQNEGGVLGFLDSIDWGWFFFLK